MMTDQIDRDAAIEAAIADFKSMNQNCDCPLHTLYPMKTSDLVTPTLNDLKSACDLIGKDTYGKPHWTPETISSCNPVVQAFARHARKSLPTTRFTREHVEKAAEGIAQEDGVPWIELPYRVKLWYQSKATAALSAIGEVEHD